MKFATNLVVLGLISRIYYLSIGSYLGPDSGVMDLAREFR